MCLESVLKKYDIKLAISRKFYINNWKRPYLSCNDGGNRKIWRKKAVLLTKIGSNWLIFQPFFFTIYLFRWSINNFTRFLQQKIQKTAIEEFLTENGHPSVNDCRTFPVDLEMISSSRYYVWHFFLNFSNTLKEWMWSSIEWLWLIIKNRTIFKALQPSVSLYMTQTIGL